MKKSIGRKIFTMLLVIAILSIVGNLSSISSMGRMNKANEEISNTYLNLMVDSLKVSKDIESSQKLIIGYIFVQDKDYKTKLYTQQNDLLTSIDEQLKIIEQLNSKIPLPTVATLFGTYKESFESYQAIIKQIFELSNQGKTAEAYSLFSKDLIGSLSGISDSYKQLNDIYEKGVDIALDNQKDAYHRALYTGNGNIIVLIIIGLFIYLILDLLL